MHRPLLRHARARPCMRQSARNASDLSRIARVDGFGWSSSSTRWKVHAALDAPPQLWAIRDEHARPLAHARGSDRRAASCSRRAATPAPREVVSRPGRISSPRPRRAATPAPREVVSRPGMISSPRPRRAATPAPREVMSRPGMVSSPRPRRAATPAPREVVSRPGMAAHGQPSTTRRQRHSRSRVAAGVVRAGVCSWAAVGARECGSERRVW